MPTNTWPPARILALCSSLGITQRELAGRLGCRESTVSDWVREIKTPSPAYCKLLDSLSKAPH